MSCLTLHHASRTLLLRAALSSAVALLLALPWAAPAPRPARAAPGVLYAAPEGEGDCSSWANACTLSRALSIATSGDEIWVRAGVHYPDTSGLSDPRSATFSLTNSVAVYGGFPDTGNPGWNDRDPQTYVTVLSGDIGQNDVNDDGNFIAETWNDIQGANAYHVVTADNVTTATLDGFIITAGQASGLEESPDSGGGILCARSHPALANLTFSGNQATKNGGGMYNTESSPTLINVSFTGNSASDGGGMYNDRSSPTLTSVSFTNNSATSGGGMYNTESSPILTDVSFTGNSASQNGGGMYNANCSPKLQDTTFLSNEAAAGGGMYNGEHSNPRLVNATFSGNVALTNGGGMLNSQSNPTLINVRFIQNQAHHNGGGMANDQSSPHLTNVLFLENAALGPVSPGYGGGIFNYMSAPTLMNATLGRNWATVGGGAVANDDSTLTMTHVIVWDNSIGRDSGSTFIISYSDIQGCGPSGSSWNPFCGTDGGGNIDQNPLFVDPSAGNLRLLPGSPCIDAGNNAAVPSGITTDLDGNGRFVDGDGDGTATVDMGAYEAQFQARRLFLPLVLRNTP